MRPRALQLLLHEHRIAWGELEEMHQKKRTLPPAELASPQAAITKGSLTAPVAAHA